MKRSSDILLILLLMPVMLVLSPFLLAAIIAIKLQDGGPVFYSQERVTQNGRLFKIHKLRTMRVGAESSGAVWAAQEDPRVTRVGAILRRRHIDELPQLLNILRGEMSFVGPRPERPAFVAQLAQVIPLYHERHTIKAGLTGWAQVNYPYGASIDDARCKLRYDLYYINNSGFILDLLIVMKTAYVVLWPDNLSIKSDATPFSSAAVS